MYMHAYMESKKTSTRKTRRSISLATIQELEDQPTGENCFKDKRASMLPSCKAKPEKEILLNEDSSKRQNVIRESPSKDEDVCERTTVRNNVVDGSSGQLAHSLFLREDIGKRRDKHEHLTNPDQPNGHPNSAAVDLSSRKSLVEFFSIEEMVSSTVSKHLDKKLASFFDRSNIYVGGYNGSSKCDVIHESYSLNNIAEKEPVLLPKSANDIQERCTGRSNKPHKSTFDYVPTQGRMAALSQKYSKNNLKSVGTDHRNQVLTTDAVVSEINSTGNSRHDSNPGDLGLSQPTILERHHGRLKKKGDLQEIDTRSVTKDAEFTSTPTYTVQINALAANQSIETRFENTGTNAADYKPVLNHYPAVSCVEEKPLIQYLSPLSSAQTEDHEKTAELTRSVKGPPLVQQKHHPSTTIQPDTSITVITCTPNSIPHDPSRTVEQSSYNDLTRFNNDPAVHLEHQSTSLLKSDFKSNISNETWLCQKSAALKTPTSKSSLQNKCSQCKTEFPENNHAVKIAAKTTVRNECCRKRTEFLQTSPATSSTSKTNRDQNACYKSITQLSESSPTFGTTTVNSENVNSGKNPAVKFIGKTAARNECSKSRTQFLKSNPLQKDTDANVPCKLQTQSSQTRPAVSSKLKKNAIQNVKCDKSQARISENNHAADISGKTTVQNESCKNKAQFSKTSSVESSKFKKTTDQKACRHKSKTRSSKNNPGVKITGKTTVQNECSDNKTQFPENTPAVKTPVNSNTLQNEYRSSFKTGFQRNSAGVAIDQRLGMKSIRGEDSRGDLFQNEVNLGIVNSSSKKSPSFVPTQKDNTVLCGENVRKIELKKTLHQDNFKYVDPWSLQNEFPRGHCQKYCNNITKRVLQNRKVTLATETQNGIPNTETTVNSTNEKRMENSVSNPNVGQRRHRSLPDLALICKMSSAQINISQVQVNDNAPVSDSKKQTRSNKRRSSVDCLKKDLPNFDLLRNNSIPSKESSNLSEFLKSNHYILTSTSDDSSAMDTPISRANSYPTESHSSRISQSSNVSSSARPPVSDYSNHKLQTSTSDDSSAISLPITRANNYPVESHSTRSSQNPSLSTPPGPPSSNYHLLTSTSYRKHPTEDSSTTHIPITQACYPIKSRISRSPQSSGVSSPPPPSLNHHLLTSFSEKHPTEDSSALNIPITRANNYPTEAHISRSSQNPSVSSPSRSPASNHNLNLLTSVSEKYSTLDSSSINIPKILTNNYPAESHISRSSRSSSVSSSISTPSSNHHLLTSASENYSTQDSPATNTSITRANNYPLESHISRSSRSPSLSPFSSTSPSNDAEHASFQRSLETPNRSTNVALEFLEKYRTSLFSDENYTKEKLRMASRKKDSPRNKPVVVTPRSGSFSSGTETPPVPLSPEFTSKAPGVCRDQLKRSVSLDDISTKRPTKDIDRFFKSTPEKIREVSSSLESLIDKVSDISKTALMRHNMSDEERIRFSKSGTNFLATLKNRPWKSMDNLSTSVDHCRKPSYLFCKHLETEDNKPNCFIKVEKNIPSQVCSQTSSSQGKRMLHDEIVVERDTKDLEANVPDTLLHPASRPMECAPESSTRCTLRKDAKDHVGTSGRDGMSGTLRPFEETLLLSKPELMENERENQMDKEKTKTLGTCGQKEMSGTLEMLRPFEESTRPCETLLLENEQENQMDTEKTKNLGKSGRNGISKARKLRPFEESTSPCNAELLKKERENQMDNEKTKTLGASGRNGISRARKLRPFEESTTLCKAELLKKERENQIDKERTKTLGTSGQNEMSGTLGTPRSSEESTRPCRAVLLENERENQMYNEKTTNLGTSGRNGISGAEKLKPFEESTSLCKAILLKKELENQIDKEKTKTLGTSGRNGMSGTLGTLRSEESTSPCKAVLLENERKNQMDNEKTTNLGTSGRNGMSGAEKLKPFEESTSLCETESLENKRGCEMDNDHTDDKAYKDLGTSSRNGITGTSGTLRLPKVSLCQTEYLGNEPDSEKTNDGSYRISGTSKTTDRFCNRAIKIKTRNDGESKDEKICRNTKNYSRQTNLRNYKCPEVKISEKLAKPEKMENGVLECSEEGCKEQGHEQSTHRKNSGTKTKQKNQNTIWKPDSSLEKYENVFEESFGKSTFFPGDIQGRNKFFEPCSFDDTQRTSKNNAENVAASELEQSCKSSTGEESTTTGKNVGKTRRRRNAIYEAPEGLRARLFSQEDVNRLKMCFLTVQRQNKGLVQESVQQNATDLSEKETRDESQDPDEDVLQKILEIVHDEFAFDGYLNDGVEDIKMAEFIISRATSSEQALRDAVRKEYKDLYWKDKVIAAMYQTIQASLGSPKKMFSTSQTAKKTHQSSTDEESLVTNNGPPTEMVKNSIVHSVSRSGSEKSNSSCEGCMVPLSDHKLDLPEIISFGLDDIGDIKNDLTTIFNDYHRNIGVFLATTVNVLVEKLPVKIKEVQQQINLERKLKRRSWKAYLKLMNNPELRVKESKDMYSKLRRDIEEIEWKIAYLRNVKRKLKNIYAERFGLDGYLLQSFIEQFSPTFTSLHPYIENNYLSFSPLWNQRRGMLGPDDIYESRQGAELQHGSETGLLAYLFARYAMTQGYVKHFLYTYRYCMTSDRLLEFIRAKYIASVSLNDSNEQTIQQLQIQYRSLDLLAEWIDDYFEVDFKHNERLCQELKSFLEQEVITTDKSDRGNLLLQVVAEKEHIIPTYLSLPQNGSVRHGSLDDLGHIELSEHRPGLDENSNKKISFIGVGRKSLPHEFSDCEAFILDYSDQVLAEQLSLIQQDLFHRVHPVHFLNTRSLGVGVSRNVSPNRIASHKDVLLGFSAGVRRGSGDGFDVVFPETNPTHIEVVNNEIIEDVIEHAQDFSMWVAAEICGMPSIKSQLALVTKLINVANYCQEIRNFETAIQILDALETFVIRQLPVWKLVTTKTFEILDHLKAVKVLLKTDAFWLIQGDAYRRKPTIPSALLFIMHVQQQELGGFLLANGRYKWAKLRSIARLVDQIHAFKELKYNFLPNEELQRSIKRRITKLKDQNLHLIASENSINFHGQRPSSSSRKLKNALEKMKSSFG